MALQGFCILISTVCSDVDAHLSAHALRATRDQAGFADALFPSPCYVEIPRGMTQEEIASIQAEANRLVFEGRKVHVEVEELNVAQEQAKTVPKLESGRSVGKALPEDYTGGVKRVVVIDGVDRNPYVFLIHGRRSPNLLNKLQQMLWHAPPKHP